MEKLRRLNPHRVRCSAMLQEKHSYTPVPALAYVFIRTKKLNMIVLGSIAKLHLGELIEEAKRDS